MSGLENAGAFFLDAVNRSIAAGWLILAVLALRYLLRKSPRWVNCLLWGIVAFRLVCPFSFESPLSLVPSAETIPVENIYSENPAVRDNPYHYQMQSGFAVIDRTVNPVITDTHGPAMRSNALIFAGLWIAGAAGMLIYAGISFWRLKKSVRASVLLKDNIYICDEVKSPFILGMIRPCIYLPSGMEEGIMAYVIAHENAHLKRRDHWWKSLGYLLLAVYWFHPLVWLAYGGFCRDIELACDERVVRDMGRADKAAYAQALLDCSFPRRTVRICPLAFGEVGVKNRVKAVLNYKRPVFWVSLAAVMVCITVAVCFLTDPKVQAREDQSGSLSEDDGIKDMQGDGNRAVLPESDGIEEKGQNKDLENQGAKDDISQKQDSGAEEAPGMEETKTGEDREELTAEALLAQMPDTFHFLSGAGGWSTELYLAKDGSFTGLYEDGEASWDPVKFPNGTTYLCEFNGSFSQPVKLEELVYSVQVQSLVYEEPEKETIENGMRYITSTPYGLENAGEVRIYLPGYPLADLPEEIQFWVKNAREYWDGNGPDTLPFYVLHNVEEELAFFSDGYLPLYGD